MIKHIKHREYISKNIFIDWKITKSDIKTDKIISCVFFLREKLSKDIDKYLKNLKALIDLIIDINDYKLRIYHDFSTLKIIKDMININNQKLKLEDKIELYEYDIPFFRDENPLYHKGTIGTLFRYLCFFDYDLHKTKIALVVDIDNDPKIITNNFLKFLEDNSNFAYRFRFMYGLKDRIICDLDDDIYQFSIIGSFVFNKFNFNKDLFSNFLEDVYIKKGKNIINMLTNCKIENFFGYGIDEIFLNKILLTYLYQNKINIQPLNLHNFQPITSNIIYIILSLDENEGKLLLDIFNKFLSKINTQIRIKDNNYRDSLKKYKNDDKFNKYVNYNLIKNKDKILPILLNSINELKNNNVYKTLILLKNYLNYHNIDFRNSHNILDITTDYDFENKKVINKEIRTIIYK